MPSEGDFTSHERAVLARYFSNVDEPVFALIDLPEVVKGALFARYSRSPKSLRRLFLDEFYQGGLVAEPSMAEQLGFEATGVARAEELYERVLGEYGDDSVAQLVGVHVAVEDASNILTKILEWGRLLAYLEQSTRYIPYNQQQDGRWRYHIPGELRDLAMQARYVEVIDRCFETYTRWFGDVEEHLRGRYPRSAMDSRSAYRLSIRAKACDILRGLLPAATTANVGIFGSAQAFEALLLRLQNHPLEEARETGRRILDQLRQVIPVFVRRIDRDDRGGAWSRYLRETVDGTHAEVEGLVPEGRPQPEREPYVRLTEVDPDGELKVVAAAMYNHTSLDDVSLLETVRRLSLEQRGRLLDRYIGDRTNRRHKPGRAFERTSYRFEVVIDYGAFRDLQRHRMLTLDWQPLSPNLGFDVPEEIEQVGADSDWRNVMHDCAALYDELCGMGFGGVASYAVPMANRIRFYMQMNAREAMHMIELRTSPQGHRAYRWVCQEMWRCILDAGHVAIARSMRFADLNGGASLERLEAELRNEERLAAMPVAIDQ